MYVAYQNINLHSLYARTYLYNAARVVGRKKHMVLVCDMKCDMPYYMCAVLLCHAHQLVLHDENNK